ncbi:YbhB/YbcL family Raf kinase inhibitor-like protein [Mycoplasma procyoni]|uniref:YbhB/YbcL family Raf kinase inhibitor-like protein n=1 Tax=Mycoplasma procyoni TaxID=568784 RepID=UPI00197C0AF9|nr:YbhB/YbcL family Raf kinase inhibitor-like protein [Mycoplasma procyoni]MBN3534503.1 YbhB/YbcL family Raf kinase inhibitor-like protein [Mycoplasma procyoni]
MKKIKSLLLSLPAVAVATFGVVACNPAKPSTGEDMTQPVEPNNPGTPEQKPGKPEEKPKTGNQPVTENKNEVYSIKINSSAIQNGVLSDTQYAASQNSKGKSLPLSWNAVEGAKSYAVILVDKMATEVIGGIYSHWGIFNIPATQTTLEADFSKTNTNTNIKQLEFSNPSSVLTGEPKTAQNSYEGPNPPAAHIYELRVFALNTETINPESRNNKYFANNFYKAIENKVVAEGVLNFSYGTNASNGSLYKSEELKKIDIETTGLENGILKSEYVASINENEVSGKTLPLSWNKVEGAKSYLLALESWSESEHSENVGMVLWGKVNIENPASGDKVELASVEIKDEDTTNNFENSLSGFFAQALLHSGNNENFEQPGAQNYSALIKKYALAKFENLTNENSSKYILRVYALDKKLTKNQPSNQEPDNGQNPGSYDVLGSYLHQAKGSVIAEGKLEFKLK